jgi:hypothetical protein
MHEKEQGDSQITGNATTQQLIRIAGDIGGRDGSGTAVFDQPSVAVTGRNTAARSPAFCA